MCFRAAKISSRLIFQNKFSKKFKITVCTIRKTRSE
ncbi:hypothetical protein CLV59_103639 [Chitinophaga dinghuensis]|uniref:Uncharacterized protein n=1 Tax=Chitinophaga dinghuensis TaxID=1539050 RepID=A0A327WC04_9BACT|nr:hypothetical protein CLV59_103639 [Chitinophaga dinghuensis]